MTIDDNQPTGDRPRRARRQGELTRRVEEQTEAAASRGSPGQARPQGRGEEGRTGGRGHRGRRAGRPQGGEGRDGRTAGRHWAEVPPVKRTRKAAATAGAPATDADAAEPAKRTKAAAKKVTATPGPRPLPPRPPPPPPPPPPADGRTARRDRPGPRRGARRGHRRRRHTADLATGEVSDLRRRRPGSRPAAAELVAALPEGQAPVSTSVPAAATPVAGAVSDEQFAAVVDGWSFDPHSVLGAHRRRRLGGPHPAARRRRRRGGRPGRHPLRGPTGLPRGRLRGPAPPAARRLPDRGRLPRPRRRHDTFLVDDPYRWLPTSASSTSTSSARAGTRSCGPSSARTCGATTPPAARRRRLLRRLGAQRPRRQGHRRLRLLGGPRLPDAVAGLLRRLGDLRARRAGGHPVPLPRARRRRPVAGQERPAGLRHRGAAGQRLGRHRLHPRVGRRRVARPPRRAPAGTSGR